MPNLAKKDEYMKSLEDKNYMGESKKTSTQQKDILFNSFKNFKNRYQYKERRTNNIQIRNEKIIRELTKKQK